MQSKGHPIDATRLVWIYELAVQPRHEAGEPQVANARFAIAENGGGFLGAKEAAAVITIPAACTRGAAIGAR